MRKERLNGVVKMIKKYVFAPQSSFGSIVKSTSLFDRAEPKLKDKPIIARADLQKRSKEKGKKINEP